MSRGFLLQCIKQVFAVTVEPHLHTLAGGQAPALVQKCLAGRNGEDLCAFCEPANETRLKGYERLVSI